MKNIFLLSLIFSIIFIAGCDENEDAAGLRGVGIVPGISNVNPAIFDSKDLENSYVQFDVSLAEGDVAEKIELVASYNGDNAKVKVQELTSFPSTVKLYAADVAELLGVSLEDINNDDLFTIEMISTSDGVVTTSNAVLNVFVACAFDPAQAEGTYNVVSDDWGTAGEVTLTADPDDPNKISVVGLATIDGLVEDQGPLVMYIDPLTYAVTAERAVLASDYFGYTNGAFEGSGLFGSCDGKYTMSFEITVDQGSFGSYTYVFTRK